jgi:hypothetical protein
LHAVSGLTPAQSEHVLLFYKVISQRLRNVKLIFFVCFWNKYYRKSANILFWFMRKETDPIAQSKDATLLKAKLANG